MGGEPRAKEVVRIATTNDSLDDGPAPPMTGTSPLATARFIVS
jgi:hypothetical protein